METIAVCVYLLGMGFELSACAAALRPVLLRRVRAQEMGDVRRGAIAGGGRGFVGGRRGG
jgi:hypothetical protein